MQLIDTIIKHRIYKENELQTLFGKTIAINATTEDGGDGDMDLKRL